MHIMIRTVKTQVYQLTQLLIHNILHRLIPQTPLVVAQCMAIELATLMLILTGKILQVDVTKRKEGEENAAAPTLVVAAEEVGQENQSPYQTLHQVPSWKLSKQRRTAIGMYWISRVSSVDGVSRLDGNLDLIWLFYRTCC